MEFSRCLFSPKGEGRYSTPKIAATSPIDEKLRLSADRCRISSKLTSSHCVGAQYQQQACYTGAPLCSMSQLSATKCVISICNGVLGLQLGLIRAHGRLGQTADGQGEVVKWALFLTGVEVSWSSGHKVVPCWGLASRVRCGVIAAGRVCRTLLRGASGRWCNKAP